MKFKETIKSMAAKAASILRGNVGVVAATFFFLAFAMALLKVLFMVVEPAYSPLRVGDMAAVVSHGFAMDCTIAGYVSVVPYVLAFVGIFYCRKWMHRVISVYFVVIAAILAVIYTVDAALYPFWGVRIDMTPLFYFSTSPSAAMASVEVWMMIVGLLAMAALWAGFRYGLRWIWRRVGFGPELSGWRRRTVASVAMLVGGGLMFVAIRGGVTTSTMNPSRSYFSQDMKLNHAALNPVFSLIYSVTHQEDFAKQFRFMDDAEAEAIASELYNTKRLQRVDSVALPRVEGTPDVYIIILESFSSHLLPSQGGEPIAMNLDKIAAEGVTFTNAYAGSFRTDRAITAILSGYLVPPTTSLMTHLNIIDNIESVPRSLAQNGYRTAYYYGGDINFTNMNAYLVAGGVEEIVCDKDFPLSERMSKWGVHDGPLFERLKADVAADRSSKPILRVVQTSSSHEPFDVPYDKSTNKSVNAFMYTDECLGSFIDWLKQTGRWENAIVVITPDHQGCYPDNLVLATDKQHIPIVFTGGAMDGDGMAGIDPELLERPVAQTDIAATLLALLGVDYSEYPFSNNAFDPRREPFAFMSRPDIVALVGADGVTVISTETKETLPALGSDANPERLHRLQAILQSLYNDLGRRSSR